MKLTALLLLNLLANLAGYGHERDVSLLNTFEKVCLENEGRADSILEQLNLLGWQRSANALYADYFKGVQPNDRAFFVSGDYPGSVLAIGYGGNISSASRSMANAGLLSETEPISSDVELRNPLGIDQSGIIGGYYCGLHSTHPDPKNLSINLSTLRYNNQIIRGYLKKYRPTALNGHFREGMVYFWNLEKNTTLNYIVDLQHLEGQNQRVVIILSGVVRANEPKEHWSINK